MYLSRTSSGSLGKGLKGIEVIVLELLIAEPALWVEGFWLKPQVWVAVGGELIHYDPITLGNVVAAKLCAAARYEACESDWNRWVNPG